MPQPNPNASPQNAAIFRMRQESFSGPLPPPAMLAEYDKVLPGGAERLVKMAESQIAHRQDIERTVIRSNARAQVLGQVFAFILSFCVICGGLFLIYQGESIEGIGTVLTTLAALAGVFVYGRRQQRKERERKFNVLPPGA